MANNPFLKATQTNPFLKSSAGNPFLKVEDPVEQVRQRYEGNLDPELVRAMGGEVDPAALAKSAVGVGQDLLYAIPSGIRGAAEAIGTGSMERGMEAMESNMQYLRENLPRFRDQKTKEYEQVTMEALEKVQRAGGEVAERAALGGPEYDRLLRERGLRGPEGAPLARTMGEVATDLAPLPVGAKAVKAARRPAPTKTPEMVDADKALLDRAKLMADEQGRPVNEVLEELATGRKDVTQADLLTDEPIPVEPGARNPYLLSEAERARLEAEMQGPTPEQIAETVRYTEATTGQRDLLDPQLSATEAKPSLRSRERPLDMTELDMQRQAGPKLQEQEYFGPRQGEVLPAEGLEYKQPHAADYAARNAEFDVKLQDIVGSGKPDATRLALAHIRDSKQIPEYLQYLADRLLKDKDFNPQLILADRILAKDIGMEINEGWMVGGLAEYKEATGARVIMSKEGGYAGKAAAILHEMMHSKVAAIQNAVERGMNLPRNVREGAQAIDYLYQYVKRHADPEFLKTHGMRDNKEFIAEAFTNSEFQKVLKDMRYKPGPGEGFLKTVLYAWDAFVHSVARVLGLEPNRIDVLSATLNEGARLMSAIEANRMLAKTAYGSMAMKQAALFRNPLDKTLPVNKAPKRNHKTKQEFMDELKAAGKNPEFLRRFGDALFKNYVDQWNKQYGYPKPQVGYDNRAHKEFRQDLYNPDGEMRIDDIKYSWGPAYTESKRHPVLNRIYDQISQAEIAINNVFNQLFRSQVIESGYGMTAMRHGKLTEHPDSVASISSKLNKKEIETFTEVVGSMIEQGKTKQLIDAPEKFLPANEARLVSALTKMRDESLKLINAERAKQGIDPIKGRDDWLVSYVRHGEYHLVSLDKDGKSVYRKGFNDLGQARQVAAKVRAQGFTDVRVVRAENDPRRVALPIEAFIEAAKMAETKGQRDLLAEAIEEASLRTGTKKYAKARDSSAGGLPLAKEEIEALGHQKTFDNFMFGVKAYANSASRYVGGHSYADRVYEVFRDSEIEMDYPNAVNAARNRWQEFQGVDKTLKDISRVANWFNQTFLHLNVIADNPVFYMANILQFGFVPPRLLAENARALSGKGNVSEAMIKGIARVYYGVGNKGETKSIIQEAVRNGSLEARFAEALDWKTQEEVSTLKKAARVLTLQKVAALSDSYSRMASYLMFYELGKSAGLDGKKAHSFAAKETQGVMIQYSRWARMPVFNKFGVVGDLASPVTSFISNMGFNVGQYMKMATKGDKAAGIMLGPVLAYLTYQVAISGVKGLPGYEDMEQLVTYLNQLYVEKFGGKWLGTPSELLNSWGANDYAVYGVPSAVTGMNMTGTLGFGHLMPSVITQVGDAGRMFPGVEMGLKVTETVGKQALAATGSELTEQERSQIMSQVMPGVTKEWVKQLYSQEGTDLSKGRKVGADSDLVYQRSPEENLKSMITGKPSLRESEYKAKVRTFKTMEASIGKAKTNAIQLMTDAVQRGKPMPKYTERVINNYPELSDGIMDKILAELKSRSIPFYERKIIESVNSSDLSTARKLETLQHLFGEGTTR